MHLEESRGNEDFRFRDRSGDDVIPILSQGDLNALALSIFYGIGESNAMGLPCNTIIFDDPSQSMAKHHKNRFAELISDAARRRQVIISTMDSELLSMLKDYLTMNMRVIEFSGWEPVDGPQVK
jgi:predicted ATPase